MAARCGRGTSCTLWGRGSDRTSRHRVVGREASKTVLLLVTACEAGAGGNTSWSPGGAPTEDAPNWRREKVGGNTVTYGLVPVEQSPRGPVILWPGRRLSCNPLGCLALRWGQALCYAAWSGTITISALLHHSAVHFAAPSCGDSGREVMFRRSATVRATRALR